MDKLRQLVETTLFGKQIGKVTERDQKSAEKKSERKGRKWEKALGKSYTIKNKLIKHMDTDGDEPKSKKYNKLASLIDRDIYKSGKRGQHYIKSLNNIDRLKDKKEDQSQREVAGV
jgi:hypothetical protein